MIADCCPWCNAKSFSTDDGDWLTCLECRKPRMVNTHLDQDPITIEGVLSAQIIDSWFRSREGL